MIVVQPFVERIVGQPVADPALHFERPAFLQTRHSPRLELLSRITVARTSVHNEDIMTSTDSTTVSLQPFAVSKDGRRFFIFDSTDASVQSYFDFVREHFPSHHADLHWASLGPPLSEQRLWRLRTRTHGTLHACPHPGCLMRHSIPWARDNEAPLKPQSTIIISTPPLSRTPPSSTSTSVANAEDDSQLCRVVYVMLSKFNENPEGKGIQVQPRNCIPWPSPQGVLWPISTLDGHTHTIAVPEFGSIGLTLSSGRFRTEKDCTRAGNGIPSLQMSENEIFAWRGGQRLGSSHHSLVADLVDGLSRFAEDERVPDILSDLRHFGDAVKNDGSSGSMEKVVRMICATFK